MASEYSVKVNKVPQGTPPEEVRAVFEAAGFTSITDVYLPEKFAKFEFGFVRFASLEEAQRVADTQGFTVRGVALACELAVNDKRRVGAISAVPRGGPPGKGGYYSSAMGSSYAAVEAPRMPQAGTTSSNEHSIWVGSLPPGTTPDHLREAFASRGVENMTDVYLPPGRDFGFVRFANSEESAFAMQSCSYLEVGGSLVELKSSTTEKRSVGQPAAVASAQLGLQGRQMDWGGAGACGKGCAGPVPHSKGGDWQGPHAWHGQGPDWHNPALQGKASTNPGKGGFCSGEWAVSASYSSLEGQTSGGRASNEYSIWIGALPEGVTPEDLRDAFRMYGVETMTDIYIPPNKDFGFIRFATYAEAEDAMRHCGAFTVQGARVELKLSISEKRSVGMGRPAAALPQQPVLAAQLPVLGGQQPVYGDSYGQHPNAPGCGSTTKASDLEVSVKVGNLAPGTTIEDLKEAFLTQGVATMTDVYIPRNKSFGFIRFHGLSEAHVAMECSGMLVRGNSVTLEMAEGEKRSSAFFVAPTAPVGASPGWVGQVACSGKGSCSGKGFGGDKGACGAAPVPASRSGEVSVKVGNLPADATPDEVRQAFAAHGIDSMTDCYIPLGRRFGFLRFTTAAEGRYALSRQIWVRGHQLELAPALGTKRTPEEMLETEMSRQKRPALGGDVGEAPHDPNISPDAPSVKVSGLPPGTAAQELHKALLDAGCVGKVTDIYVPKGNRGFGFVRFALDTEAEDASRLEVWIRGAQLGMDIAVQERKIHSRLDEGGGAEAYRFAEMPNQGVLRSHAGGWH
mmetsp:Transcript_1267/g.3585  ORF Transcript_1267/g.3585 Transcript_1267/m.3585 type:complete len:795 (-) Transcript_1267:175-2559(-)